MPSVLIVDDVSAIREMLAAVIHPTGYEIAFASDGDEALEKFKAEPADVVLADIAMQPMDGIMLLQELKAFDPDCVVIMMTGYASTDTAIKALKFGAFDYIQKPLKVDELIKALKRAVDFRARERSSTAGNAEVVVNHSDISNHFVGQGLKMQRIRQQMVKLMAARAPLLIHGERGTGKKTIAELVHKGGGEEKRPFVVCDCALSDETSIKSGLIGEGAGGDWIASAKGGTMFLQHIESLPLEYQQILVGVLKSNINQVRVIGSTEADLESLVEEGKFDDELFYRIAALPVHLPPLREHIEDLPDLIKHFLQEAKNPSFEGGQIEFSDKAMDRFAHYAWPGNIKELWQVVCSLASTSEKRLIDVGDLPSKIVGTEGWPTLREHMASHEAVYVRKVVRGCGGDIEKAAQVLDCDIDLIERIVAQEVIV